MRRGIVVPQHDVSAATAVSAAIQAEEAGLDSVWVIEHLHGRPAPERPILECWTLLAHICASTKRVTVGTLVTRVGLRAPMVTAVMARTLNDIADGRLVVGLGLGDPTVREEQEAYGLGYLPRAQRVAQAEATISAIRDLAGVAVWVGGTSDEALRLAASASGLNLWVPPDKVPTLAARARRTAPAGMELSWAGSWPRSGLGEVIAAGVDHVIVATGGANFAERISGLAAL